MIQFFTIGTILGLSAGFAPGPLLTLVISETLEHDIQSGVRVALAPIFTDLPIIVLTLFVFSKLSSFNAILGSISLVGGIFVLSMGYKNIRAKKDTLNLHEVQPKSLSKGIITNFLSPHPYLFWFSVGSPLVIKAMGIGIAAALVFISSFYVFLIGSKVGLAVLIGKYKSFLNGRIYIYTVRFLGIVLCVFALMLLHEALDLLELL